MRRGALWLVVPSIALASGCAKTGVVANPEPDARSEAAAAATEDSLASLLADLEKAAKPPNLPTSTAGS